MPRAPEPDIYAAAAELLLARQPTSRNKNFDAFRDPRTKKTMALYRRLRALVNDLEKARAEGWRVKFTPVTHRGKPSVRIDFTGTHTRRSAWIERAAWEVLLLHPAAADAVATLDAA
jgi:hypothetical protein